MKNNFITVSLNNGTSQVLEQKNNEYLSYTVMGTIEDNNINYNDIITPQNRIEPNELFNFLTCCTAEKIFRKVQLKYLSEDFSSLANELGVELDEDDCFILAERYTYKQDCTIPSNDQMVCMIEDYVEALRKQTDMIR